MVKVYFESKIHSELIATFETEELYDACRPILGKLARESRMSIRESIN